MLFNSRFGAKSSQFRYSYSKILGNISMHDCFNINKTQDFPYPGLIEG